MLNTINHQGTASQNHNELSPHTQSGNLIINDNTKCEDVCVTGEGPVGGIHH